MYRPKILDFEHNLHTFIYLAIDKKCIDKGGDFIGLIQSKTTFGHDWKIKTRGPCVNFFTDGHQTWVYSPDFLDIGRFG